MKSEIKTKVKSVSLNMYLQLYIGVVRTVGGDEGNDGDGSDSWRWG